MKLIKPSFEIIEQAPGIQGVKKQIELAGRTCYKSEDKITDTSCEEFVNRMVNSGHGAMLEHGTVYLQIPFKCIDVSSKLEIPIIEDLVFKYTENKYSQCVTINHVAYITKELAGCITSQFHVVLRPKNKEKMNVDYYHGVLYRLSVNGKMAACKNTNAARTSIIKLSEFKALTVPAPDEEGQKAGAKIFIQFQERIKLLQELIEMEKKLIGAEKEIFDGINRTEVHASELINLHKKWKKESVVKVKKISRSWDDFLCDVINSTR